LCCQRLVLPSRLPAASPTGAGALAGDDRRFSLREAACWSGGSHERPPIAPPHYAEGRWRKPRDAGGTPGDAAGRDGTLREGARPGGRRRQRRGRGAFRRGGASLARRPCALV
jgi:hypothetical protein